MLANMNVIREKLLEAGIQEDNAIKEKVDKFLGPGWRCFWLEEARTYVLMPLHTYNQSVPRNENGAMLYPIREEG